MKSKFSILRDHIEQFTKLGASDISARQQIYDFAQEIGMNKSDVDELIQEHLEKISTNSFEQSSGFISEDEIAENSSKTLSGFISNEDDYKNFNSQSIHFTEVSVLPNQGNMSLTQKAKYLGKWVVVKRLHEHLRNNLAAKTLFNREFETAYHLDHPHIVRINGKGSDAEGDYFFMEYIDGRTLSSAIKNNELTPELVRKISLETLDALNYVHKKQIFHRDLKPDNILLSYRGDNVKIVDFGLADSDDTDDFLSKAGTPRYAAPEQSDKNKRVDQRSDIYAFGLVLLEMLTGDINPANISEIQPDNYRLAVRKSLEFDPQNRFDNCAQIIELLKSNAELPKLIKSKKRKDLKPPKAAKPKKEKKFEPKNRPKKMIWPILGLAVLLFIWWLLTIWAGEPSPNTPDISENQGSPGESLVEDKVSITAEASSFLLPGKEINYYATNAIDHQVSTAWVEGVTGQGIGEWLQINLSKETKVKAITIANGFNLVKKDKTGDRFYKNGRVKKAQLVFSDGSKQEIDIKDERGYQTIPINPVKSKFVRLVILEVYPGFKWEDVCISEFFPETS